MDTKEKSFMLDVHNTTTSEDILKRYISFYKNEPPSSERGMVVNALQHVLDTLEDYEYTIEEWRKLLEENDIDYT